jgi:DNA-binding NarL/FixJ family response regulator
VNRNPTLLILSLAQDAGSHARLTATRRNGRLRLGLQIAESLAKGTRPAAKPAVDIILLTLSDCQGFRTLTYFPTGARQIPVIVPGGTSDDMLGEQAFRMGAQDILVKHVPDGAPQ